MTIADAEEEKSRAALPDRTFNNWIALPLIAVGLSACVSGGSNPGIVGALNSAQPNQTTSNNQTSNNPNATGSATPGVAGVPKPRPNTSGDDATSLALASTDNSNAATKAVNTLADGDASKPVLPKKTNSDEQPVTVAAVQPKPEVKPSFFERMFGKQNQRPSQPARTRSAATTTPPKNAVSAKPASDEAAKPTTPKPTEKSTAKSGTGTSTTQPEATAEKPAETEKKPKRRGFLAGLFAAQSNATSARNSRTKKRRRPRRIIALERAERGEGVVLPGVRKDVYGFGEIEDGDVMRDAVRLASVGGAARVGPYGLRVQRPDVQVGCFKPGLVRILKQVERRYKRAPIVTSGYRSPSKNRRIRGARRSTHMYCMAADIQVTGVSKWHLAKYLRSLPGRGGVGTYCHTKSVHIDIGPKREWNWRCRRKRKRRRG
ncbi:MAG: D-Ala-D-Ala carboxypeptidase family metallohydrolase [Pseudomonadota bacterium]